MQNTPNENDELTPTNRKDLEGMAQNIVITSSLFQVIAMQGEIPISYKGMAFKLKHTAFLGRSFVGIFHGDDLLDIRRYPKGWVVKGNESWMTQNP